MPVDTNDLERSIRPIATGRRNWLFAIVLLLAQAPLAKAEISRVSVALPTDVDWVKVSDDSDGDTYLREWIPSGSTVADTDLWMIVEQRLPLKKKTSSRRFLNTMMKLAREACTDVLYNGPEKIAIENYKSYWGRIFCAKQRGKPYGTITDLRVLAEGTTVFVITSEIRTPPSSVAGVFSVTGSSQTIKALQKLKKSALVARESVSIDVQPDAPSKRPPSFLHREEEGP